MVFDLSVVLLPGRQKQQKRSRSYRVFCRLGDFLLFLLVIVGDDCFPNHSGQLAPRKTSGSLFHKDDGSTGRASMGVTGRSGAL